MGKKGNSGRFYFLGLQNHCSPVHRHCLTWSFNSLVTETSWSYLCICYSFAAGHSGAQRNPRAGSGGARLPSLLVSIACGLSRWDSHKPLSSLTTDFTSDNLLRAPQSIIFVHARQWHAKSGFGQHGCHTEFLHQLCSSKGSPGGTSGEDPPVHTGDIRDVDSIPGLGRSPVGGHGNPLHYFCLGNPMDRGAWWATDSMRSQKLGHDWMTNTFVVQQKLMQRY